jgi:membrane associated rhomboid family serine protease
LIPLRDTLDDRGGVVATAILLIANAVLFGFGLFGAGFWTLLVSLLAIWLFGAALEKKAGPIGLVGIYLVALALASLIAGLASAGSGPFLFFPTGAALGLGLVLVATVPGAKIATLIPIPFAMGLYEVPAVVILVLLAVIALLLNGA